MIKKNCDLCTPNLKYTYFYPKIKEFILDYRILTQLTFRRFRSIIRYRTFNENHLFLKINIRRKAK